ncbi:hypothetical protein ACFV9P_30030 [Streptomyces sp. NPDC059892]
MGFRTKSAGREPPHSASAIRAPPVALLVKGAAGTAQSFAAAAALLEA